MSSFRHVIALVLLALWLPATVHCGLEGLLEIAADSCCHAEHSDAPAAPEHCAIERGDFRGDPPENLIVAPTALLCWCGELIRPPSIDAAATIQAPRIDTGPPELIRTWQFAARAAWPANAPSLVS